jgi:hypothetical protein
MRSWTIEFCLYGIVILLVDDVVYGVAVYQQILHAMAQIFCRIVWDVQKLAILGEHHEKAWQCLMRARKKIKQKRSVIFMYFFLANQQKKFSEMFEGKNKEWWWLSEEEEE